MTASSLKREINLVKGKCYIFLRFKIVPLHEWLSVLWTKVKTLCHWTITHICIQFTILTRGKNNSCLFPKFATATTSCKLMSWAWILLLAHAQGMNYAWSYFDCGQIKHEMYSKIPKILWVLLGKIFCVLSMNMPQNYEHFLLAISIHAMKVDMTKHKVMNFQLAVNL